MMLKNERILTLNYTNRESRAGAVAILRTDGSLLIRPDKGPCLVVEGVAEAVLEENEKYLAWREAQGGTPGKIPEEG